MTIEERVSVLRRLRERLIEQRSRFMQYLDMLDREYAARDQDAHEQLEEQQLERQLTIEREIVGEIERFQRSIDPLETLYRHAYPEQELEIPPLRSALQSVQQQVIARVERNARTLRPDEVPGDSISDSGEPLHTQLRGKSVFADTTAPYTIDIST